MTKDEAIQVVASIATQWAENEEESLPCGRIVGEFLDDDALWAQVLADEFKNDPDERDRAQSVREVWQAIRVLTGAEL